MNRKQLGYYGQDFAEQYLREQGFCILKTNFTVLGGEIDIIARKGNRIHFVEVKAARSLSYGSGPELINDLQAYHLLKTAEMYLNWYKDDVDYQIDMIFVQVSPHEPYSLLKTEYFADIVEE